MVLYNMYPLFKLVLIHLFALCSYAFASTDLGLIAKAYREKSGLVPKEQLRVGSVQGETDRECPHRSTVPMPPSITLTMDLRNSRADTIGNVWDPASWKGAVELFRQIRFDHLSGPLNWFTILCEPTTSLSGEIGRTLSLRSEASIFDTPGASYSSCYITDAQKQYSQGASCNDIFKAIFKALKPGGKFSWRTSVVDKAVDDKQLEKISSAIAEEVIKYPELKDRIQTTLAPHICMKKGGVPASIAPVIYGVEDLTEHKKYLHDYLKRTAFKAEVVAYKDGDKLKALYLWSLTNFKELRHIYQTLLTNAGFVGISVNIIREVSRTTGDVGHCLGVSARKPS
jgi:hypothetical protein